MMVAAIGNMMLPEMSTGRKCNAYPSVASNIPQMDPKKITENRIDL